MKFLSYSDLSAVHGIPGSRVTIWRKERAGRFPKRTPFGDRAYGWLDAVLDAYLAALAAGSNEQEATRIAENVRGNIGGMGAPRP